MDEKENTIRALLFSPCALFLADRENGVIFRVNASFCMKSGYDEAFFIGKALTDLECFKGSDGRDIRWVIPNDRSWFLGIEADLICASGDVQSYVLSSGVFSASDLSWIVVSGHENTERREFETALKHSEFLYREAQEIAHIGHWELDLISQKLSWSEEIFRIFDMDPLKFSASYETFLDLIHPDDRDMVDQAYRDSVANDTPYDVVHRLRMKDGRIKYVNERGKTERDDSNRPLRSIGTVQDITALKESEKARERIEKQLRQSQKLEAIGTLAGGIAHDFNNILFAINGFAEMSLEMTEAGGSLHKNIQRIFEAGSRAKDLVSQILTFCRKNTEQKKTIMIRGVVRETLKLIRATLPTSIRIVETLESSSRIYADATQIHQVVMNLCSNSAHAMLDMDKGELTVELRDIDVDPEFAKRFLGMPQGKYVKLMVSDTGHGMNHEIRDRMFEPFFTTKGEGVGTGMGLSVVHGIVKTHDGQILVYSEPGRGTTIKVFFPVADPSVEQEQAIDRPIPGGNERILLVDDEKALAELMDTMLSSLGYRVIAVSDSLAALELYQTSPDDFDLLITDMNMPDMNGLRLAEQILAMTPTMKVIIGTGFSERISETLVRESGIHELIFKPIVKRDLAEAVRRVLDAVVNA